MEKHAGDGMTSKELVLRTLEFRNTEGRAPRQLWTLPWATEHYPDTMKQLEQEFVWDFDGPQAQYQAAAPTQGDPYAIGEYTDEWGCVFTNIHGGVIGEVKHPIVVDDDWADVGNVHIPKELLSFDVEQVNASCAEKKDKFLFGGCCPVPMANRDESKEGTGEPITEITPLDAGKEKRCARGRLHGNGFRAPYRIS